MIGDRLREISDRVEEELRNDEVIIEEDAAVIKECIKKKQTGDDETDAPDGIDFKKVYDHLKLVFSHLLSWEELRNGNTYIAHMHALSCYPLSC